MAYSATRLPGTHIPPAGIARQAPSWAYAVPFTLVWATSFPATKLALLDSPPLLFLAVRFFLSGILLLAWACWQGERVRPSRADWPLLIVLACCNHAVFLGLGWSAMREASAGLATIIVSAGPIVVSILAVPVLGERLTWRKAAGLLMGFAGMVFIVRHRLNGQLDTLHGTLLLAALALLSTGTVLYKRLPISVGSSANVALQLLLAAAIMLPWALATEHLGDIHLGARLAASMAWSVAIISISGYMLWFALLRRTDASRASAWLFLTPPLGLLAGWALLGEPLAWEDFLGVVPVIAGVALVTRTAQAKPSTSR